ncbi:hypothetical protein EQG49_03025 [Periweissella cryptocerci]|uniref:N-acetylmuramoyl-L-alanine amidase domain-containing protein n=2 Tax=Periweissella cryptocerci TaxID=2506420 RepID=A0A4P6YX53_9LACO|nr:hypothetical protein EQG49_03025 [Periweissella cryptocerci]
MQLNKQTYLYNSTTFATTNRVSKLKAGTQITIKGIAWSSNGYPRLKIKGGYVTSSKTTVGAVQTPATTDSTPATTAPVATAPAAVTTPPAPAVVTIDSSNQINKYIQANHFKQPAKITSSIWSGFPKNKYTTSNAKPNGVVVHETANPTSTITGEISYMKAHYTNAFVHSFVDDNNIINVANTNYLAWGSGYYGNQRFVQFEEVRVHSKDAFAKEINNAAYYTAYLLKEYGLKPSLATSSKTGTVWSHHNVSDWLGGTDHTDPDGYWATSAKTWFNTTYTMKDFLPIVQAYYNSL